MSIGKLICIVVFVYQFYKTASIFHPYSRLKLLLSSLYRIQCIFKYFFLKSIYTYIYLGIQYTYIHKHVLQQLYRGKIMIVLNVKFIIIMFILFDVENSIPTNQLQSSFIPLKFEQQLAVYTYIQSLDLDALAYYYFNTYNYIFYSNITGGFFFLFERQACLNFQDIF